MRAIALILFIGFFGHIQAAVPVWVAHDPTTNEGDLDNAKFCENLEVGDEIYTLKATGGDGTFVYSIVSPGLRSYAEVNESTGVITLTRKFDYEIEFFFAANVLVESDGESVEKTGFINIEDDNDNSPFFYNLPYTVQDIYEYPWTADVLLTVKAEDVDNAESGSVTLLFSDDLDMLQFYEYTSGGTGNIRLKEGKKLDFETSPVLATNIIAKDNGDKGGDSCGGDRSLNTSTSFILQVLDGPNKPPVFDKLSYQFQVEENGDFLDIATVTARDQDYTLNWEIQYSILDSDVNGIFSIDQNTGQLSVNSSAIDREEVTDNGGFYSFTVQAIEIVPNDSSFSNSIVNFPFNATVEISVQVIDINDNSPIFYELEDIFSFDDKILKNVFNTTIDENTANAIALPDLNIFVQDIDDIPNARFVLSLEGEGSNVFSISPVSAQGEAVVTLRVANSSALDFEKVQSYTFTIVADEQGTDHSATATVTVHLQDTNDNSPVFDEPGTLSVNISENAVVGDSVITITATDKDSGKNQEIKYSMDPETEFAINENTGGVTVKAALDREIVSTYYLSVSATDGGNRVAMATLQVQLIDENDKSPRFQRSSYYGVVEEGSDKFTTELLILATDDDAMNTPNSELVYSIISGPIMEYFSVNQSLTESGEAEIIVIKAINFEELPAEVVNCDNTATEITLIAMAQDKGSPPLNGTVPVTILIEDVNDNPPIFPTNYTAQVPEESKVGVVIIEVQATDADSCSPNNNIQYQIGANSIPASTTSAFKINTNHTEAGYIGVLEVNSANLDRDEISEYEVEILAIDEGGDRLTGTATIVVTIEDINNKNPEFDEITLEPLNVNENATIDEVVRTIVATDPDSNAALEYNITDCICQNENNQNQDKICSTWFYIQSVNQTGELMVGAELDREKVEFVSLLISVTDVNGTEQQRVTDWIEINIIDKNDNSPQFTNMEDTFTVKEEEAPGSYIGEVTATDADKGINSVIIFSVGSDGKEWVEIDPESGRLTSKDKHIDREEQGDWLNITVIATDMGNPPLSNETKIFIRIIDINDNVPEFDESIYNATISEGSDIGFVVVQVQAYDNDTNESIRYFITNGDDFGQFEINDTTGSISVRSKLDREILSFYKLTVEARDNGGSGDSFSDTATVTIHIEDVNDEAPEFTQNIYTPTIREDAGVNDLVTDKIIAVDPDEGENGEVVYAIVSGNEEGHFSIKSTNGAVYVNKSLENKEREYVLNISATDMGESPYTSTCLLEITVEDTNNNNPQFLNLPTNKTVSVPENSPIFYEVFQVETYDNDTGLNADIIYELTEGSDYFSIDPNGIITTKSLLDYESLQSVSVQVSIQDRGSPVLENEESLTIYITDVDDNDPVYTDQEQKMSVDENNEVSSVVGTVNEADDKDTKNNSINYYYIVGGTGRPIFSLDKFSRKLSAEVSLDREDNDSYDLVVKASKDENFTVPNNDVSFTSSDSSLLLVNINVTDLNDNPPIFTTKEYITDIPHDTQPGTGAIVIEVTATDKDLPENADIVYAITEAVWIINGVSTSAEGVFAIDTRDGKGQISVAKQIEGKQEGRYELRVTASDGIADHQASTQVIIGIVQEDETVVLYSRTATAAFTEEYKDQLMSDLGAILNATVIITKVIEHDPASGFPQAQSDIYLHAKENGGTSLIPKEQVILALNSNTEQTIGFLNNYGIIGNEGISIPVTQENDYLKAGLIIACGIAVLVFVLFTIAMCCQSRKFKQKISVLKAAEKASTAMQDFKKSGDGFDLPTTNVNAANPLFNDDEKVEINMNFWQESSDDISIDDNAVDSQDDSAIGVENNAFVSNDVMSPEFMDDDQLESDLDIEFQSPNRAQLAAALNAASQMRGTDNFANLFEAEMGPENTAM